MAKKNGKQSHDSKEGKPSTTSNSIGLTRLANVDINTEDGQRKATNGLWNALASGTAEPDLTRLMLSTIGKVLVRENMKIRTGFYKMSGAKSQFFLVSNES